MVNTRCGGGGSDILDTGTPPGERAGAQGNPAPLVDMLHNVYPNNNIIFEKGYCYYVPAKNGIAQGQRKPLPCSVFNHGAGFGFGFSIGTPDPSGSQISQENMDKKLAYRQLYMMADWATKELNDLVYTGGFARGGGQGGGSDGGQRIIHATIGGQSQQIYIDTGTDAILGAGNGNKQCTFDPNPQSISVPSTSHRQGRLYFVPAWSISQRIKICLTSEYTICQSLGQGGTISYEVSSGRKTTGDIMQGKAWGEAAPSIPQVPSHQQQKRGPNYTQPLAQEPQQNQYFPSQSRVRGYGYGYGYYYPDF